jgi:hypothetical protein
MNKAERLRLIIEELRKRGVVAPLNFLDPSFPAQYKAAIDKSFLKAIQCTRRAGKSVGEGKDTLQEMYNLPGSSHLYGALTLSSAKNIIWDVLINELETRKIKYRANEQQGFIRMENDSTLRLFGLDSSYKEMRKLLGGKYKTAKIDEAGSITQDLKKIVYQMIMPALADLSGRAVLLGTAENIPNTFFEKVTSGKEPGWSVHKWTTLDNPYMRTQWEEHLKWIDEHNPTYKLTSEYRTHYLNEWCANDSLIIIKTNQQTIVKPIEIKNPTYLLGVDIGYNDACAFTLGAFGSNSPSLYVVSSRKERELDITDTANRIKEYLRKYPIQKIVIDGANKQGVEEIRKRHNILLNPAEKTDKSSFLRILADDVTRGRVLYFENECESLIEEQASLQWEDETKQKEDPRIPNDQNDSFLYMWREARNYLWKEAEPKIDKNSNQYMEDYAKRLYERRKQEQDY